MPPPLIGRLATGVARDAEEAGLWPEPPAPAPPRTPALPLSEGSCAGHLVRHQRVAQPAVPCRWEETPSGLEGRWLRLEVRASASAGDTPGAQRPFCTPGQRQPQTQRPSMATGTTSAAGQASMRTPGAAVGQGDTGWAQRSETSRQPSTRAPAPPGLWNLWNRPDGQCRRTAAGAQGGQSGRRAAEVGGKGAFATPARWARLELGVFPGSLKLRRALFSEPRPDRCRMGDAGANGHSRLDNLLCPRQHPVNLTDLR